MDINTFYAFTSAACFTLVGLWWTVVKDRPEWFKDDAMRQVASGVYASFLIPALMSMGAQVGGESRFIWQAVFVIASVAGIVFSSKLIRTAKALNPNGIFSKYSWIVPLLYALVLVYAIFPGLAGIFVLLPLQMEGILLTVLLLAGHLLAWEFIARPA